MKVKGVVTIFFLSGIFWVLITLLTMYSIEQTNLAPNLTKEDRESDMPKNMQYSKEQLEFIHKFKISFNDR